MSTDFAFAPYNPNQSWADEDEVETQKQIENMAPEELEFYNKNSNTYASKMEVVVDKKKHRKEKKKSRSPKKN
jgi:DNA replication initiation complex subunit (GINS family)